MLYQVSEGGSENTVKNTSAQYVALSLEDKGWRQVGKGWSRTGSEEDGSP